MSEDAAHPRTMRLQRFLARSGVASRRGSEDLMTAGRVTVNGSVVTELGSKVDPALDKVAVDGRAILPFSDFVYLMINKPVGVLTTMHDPQGRPCVAEIVPCDEHPGLFPVGRLDFDTTGLLLFTTDGDLGQGLLHPSHHVWKTYAAKVDGIMTEKDLQPLRDGLMLDDGPCQPARCRVLSTDRAAAETSVEVSIHEGRKNQVKRMLGAVGHPVLKLHRSSFGPLVLGDLAEGAWRYLSDGEAEELKDASR